MPGKVVGLVYKIKCTAKRWKYIVNILSYIFLFCQAGNSGLTDGMDWFGRALRVMLDLIYSLVFRHDREKFSVGNRYICCQVAFVLVMRGKSLAGISAARDRTGVAI